jgi:hypothetical protein
MKRVRIWIGITALLAAATVVFGFHHWIGLTAWFSANTVASGLETILDAMCVAIKNKE